MSHASDISSVKDTSVLTVITDIQGDPIKVDNNPAHFDGLLFEIADFIKRTGKFSALIKHGIAIRGAKTIVESPTHYAFYQNQITGAKKYDADDPCPPTDTRLALHNAARAAAGSPAVLEVARLPATAGSDIVVNSVIIDMEALEFLALC